MSLSAKIREQLISSFRAELAEHMQTLNDGLLAIEQRKAAGEQRAETLENIFRAAHSLKGAARAVGMSAIEQLAHALEDVLSALQQQAAEPPAELFNACYRAVDAIQLVEQVYASGGSTPPPQALKALTDLEPFRHSIVDQRPPTTDYRPPTTDHRPPTTDHQPPTTDPSLIPNTYSLAPTQADETIRVSVSKLDALMAQLSELLVTKIRAEQRLAQVRHVQEQMAAWQKEWLAIRSGYSRLARQVRELTTVVSVDMETASAGRLLNSRHPAPRRISGDGRLEKEMARLLNYVDASQERLRQVNGLMNILSREYANDTMHTALVIDELEQEIKRVRMLPLATITGPFARMVRDMSCAAGKEATLEIQGAQVELDKRVLEQIKDPLTHLLRNAVDHGLELPEQRLARGKPRMGTITLSAEQLGKDVVIAISDDGAGLDAAAIRQTALRKGLHEAQTMSDAELVELIFDAGFSTSPIITDVSGRGVGLDVVRRNVEALHGRINVEWTPGAGSTFKLTLPLALTSSRGLIVRVSDQLFAIPLNSIERIEYVQMEHVVSLGGRDTLRYGGRPLTLVRLNDVLGLPRPNGNQPDSARMPVVILSAAEKRMAFAVDELAGEQEVVVKGLGRQLSRVGGISGATVMGSGEVILILNVADLIKLAQRPDFGSRLTERAAEPDKLQVRPAAQAPARFILVVDDSITTRTLEKNILEAAGYTVQLATDGQEALNAIAAGGIPDLIVSDIAMPRLDGFALTQRIKSDARTANVPVILVTSLDSPEDKAHGIQVGADAYIVKSGFDQNNLLETIEQLI